MNSLSTSILSAALIAKSVNATLGIACVDDVLVSVFDMINECRTTVACDAATDYTGSMAEGADSAKWVMRNNASAAQTLIEVTAYTSTIADQKTFISTTRETYIGASGALTAMTWSEGLALGAQTYTAEWQGDPTFTSMTTPTGTTTTSRAAANGSVSGSITETAYFYTTFAVDPLGMMRFIITNDGSSIIADAFFSVDSEYLDAYLVMGASYATVNGCIMNADITYPAGYSTGTPSYATQACDMIFDIVVATGYTNGAGVAECSASITYGGGDCDPDAQGQAVFEAINTMRSNVGLWATYITEGDGAALVTFPSSFSAVATFTNTDTATNLAAADGVADVTSSMSLIRQKTNVATCATAMAASSDPLAKFEWVGGLARAASDQATFLSTADSLTSAGTGGSTFATRLAEYGTAAADAIEILHGSDNTATWVVLDMLISDLDSSDDPRTALLSSTIKQAGVMAAANTSYTYVYVTALDSNFVDSAEFTCEATVVVTEVVTGATELAIAASFALASALFI